MASDSGTMVDVPASSSEHIPIPPSNDPKIKIGSFGIKTPPNSPWIPTSPWGLKDNGAVPHNNTSFEEVMSEQLANQLHLAETQIEPEANLQETGWNLDDELVLPAMNDTDTSNDFIIAQMLQSKMDKEYNDHLAKQEKQVNQNSKNILVKCIGNFGTKQGHKVSENASKNKLDSLNLTLSSVKLSFSKYRTDETFQSEDEEDDNKRNEENYASFSNADPSSDMLQFKNEKGYVKFGNELVTKHDLEINGRKNTAKLEDSFPVGFNTGDARGMDLQLSNKIYNSLKKYAYSEDKRGQRLHEEKEHYTAEHAVDEKTRLILHRLVDRGIISSVNGVISIGKEAVVIHADGGDVVAAEETNKTPQNKHDLDVLNVPKECVIKVYKTTLNEFKTRDKYIKDDYRFKDRFKKLNPRKIIHMWAEKEMHNLNRMTEAGIACPEVVLLRKHLLVMSFIGHNQQPAPKLKDAILSSSQKKSAFEQVLSMMKTLYQDCKLVHADLSEFNLLWHEHQVWMIDVSQSVEPSHPNALEFLLRDCHNISKFFTNLGLKDVPCPMELFNQVSGLDIPITDETAFRSAISVLQNSAEEHAHQGRRKASQILDQTDSY